MNPGRLKLRFGWGTSINRSMRCTERADGAPWPFSGCAGLWQIRPSANSETVLVQGTTEDGHMTLVDGKITINTDDITPTQMKTMLPPGTYTFGLSISSGSSGWVSWIDGQIEIYKQGARL